MSNGLRCLGKELIEENLSCIQTHEHPTAEQEAADSQSANALNLAVTVGKPLRWGLEGP